MPSTRDRVLSRFADAMLDASRHPMWALDADFVLRRFNPAFRALMRREFELDVEVGASVDDLPDSIRSAHRAAYRRALASGSHTLDWPAPSGRIYAITIDAIPEDVGRGVVVHAVDVTTERQHKEVVEVARQEAERSNRAKSDFLAMISHELRTPLNAIVGLSDLLVSPDVPPEFLGFAERIQSNSSSLLHLLNDLLDFSKIEAGLMDIRPVDTDLAALFREVVGSLQTRAESRGLAFSVEVADDFPPLVHVDPTRFRQVVLNLVSNAVKYTHQGSVVSQMKVTDDRRWIELAVQDTGLGIPKSEQELVFTRFYRAYRSSTGRTPGTGLGLAITKAIVNAMEGKVRLKSRPGQGSVFKVRLPLVEIERAPSVERTWRRTLHLLCADDHPDNHVVIRAALAGRPTRFTFVGDGDEVLHTLDAPDRVDAVLMDVDMPRLDGIRTTVAIREREVALGLPRLPVLAVTAHATSDVRRRCQGAGMDAFLVKPLEPVLLLRALDQVLDDAPRVLVVDDDPSNRFVLERALERSGAHVACASTLAEGRAALTGTAVDLLIVDYELPDGQGDGLAEDAVQRGVRVIGFSGHTDAAHDALWRAAGAAAVLHKPITLDGLRRCVGDVLGRHEGLPDLTEQLPRYLDEKRADLGRMERAFAKGDLETIRRVAHQLKGTGTAYGRPDLTMLGGELEEAAMANDPGRVADRLAALAGGLTSGGGKGDLDNGA